MATQNTNNNHYQNETGSETQLYYKRNKDQNSHLNNLLQKENKLRASSSLHEPKLKKKINYGAKN